MRDLAEHTQPEPLSADAPGRLADRVERTLARAAREPYERHVLRLSEPLVGPVHPLRWLSVQPPGEKVYWSGREDAGSVAAAGVADLISPDATGGPAALCRLQSAVAGSGARYYGGLRFDPETEASDAWAPFGAWRFVLPRLELISGAGGAELACNLLLPGDADRPEEVLAGLSEAASPSGGLAGDLPLPISRLDSPDRAGWDLNVGHALSAFRGGELENVEELEKVVLARRAEFEFAGELDPELLLANLEAATPGTFHFGLGPDGGGATFIGASPERLYRREGRKIQSEAVAGTLPRGDSEESDDTLRRRLLDSGKLRREQDHVRKGIRESLAGLCDELEVEEGVSEMKLATRRHLVSGVRGRLRAGVTDADLLSALSPTPAVGGHPKEAARRFLREVEPFDRGFYAGPVGWIGDDAAEFAVGIRSGLVEGHRLSLYSGNGIVQGSEPEEEWREVEQKISDFATILGLR
ncbi:isochorismate synthase [Rubrobacter aplysinae]|uniref:isochorismate synthase n=1 Tax=Rubrobacter aplysinae TaxID=909625 RepID=UPI00069CCE27|nr:isochorismate synthase [Rubrobacter aplysinae]